MAVRFNLDKYQQVKKDYKDYLVSGKYSYDLLQNFAAYKPYLEADEEIKKIQKEIKSKKEAERKRLEEQKIEERKRNEALRRENNATIKAARKSAKAEKEAKRKAKAEEKRHRKEVQKANRRRQHDAIIKLNNSLGGSSTMWRSNNNDTLANPQPAKIIYTPMGGQPKR